ncbi:response regulator transcription factor [Maritimibacter sp. DP1N21-5]|uniref:LuxR C-terminal-related transcriptional regulator n=1 Tax=Maritimibacter sp. DP1N21-5 TaxID=2836867 RepID=UPI001C448F66|nr:response regulator transcription factor [Maritimibacter sp. DP1N21-5]MBV7409621.1 response regulator transcription factor [Maritimibacter sp. DP1N21-5]
MSVAVVDDHPLFRQGVVSILESKSIFASILEGANADDAARLARLHLPDLMLLDLDMPGGGMQALKRVRDVSPDTKCVLLTVCDTPGSAIKALNEGARGYILKGVGVEELCGALTTVLDEGTFVSPAFATTLLRAAQVRNALSTGGDVALTQREVQVLRALEAGDTNKEIASRLSISEKTVKFYMTNIMQKFGVKNRVAAVMAFQRMYGAREATAHQPRI